MVPGEVRLGAFVHLRTQRVLELFLVGNRNAPSITTDLRGTFSSFTEEPMLVLPSFFDVLCDALGLLILTPQAWLSAKNNSKRYGRDLCVGLRVNWAGRGRHNAELREVHALLLK